MESKTNYRTSFYMPTGLSTPIKSTLGSQTFSGAPLLVMLWMRFTLMVILLFSPRVLISCENNYQWSWGFPHPNYNLDISPKCFFLLRPLRGILIMNPPLFLIYILSSHPSVTKVVKTRKMVKQSLDNSPPPSELGRWTCARAKLHL